MSLPPLTPRETTDGTSPDFRWGLAPTGHQVGLVGVATLALIGAGALTFAALERDNALESRAKYKSHLSHLIASGNFTKDQLVVVEDIISHHGDHWCMPHMALDDPWNSKSSLYFTLVLISTVGYGDLAPETSWGKAAAVFFSLVGVPLLLSFTVPLSRRFVELITAIVRRLYITRAVARAMDAVELKRGIFRSGVRVDYRRRMPSEDGVGVSNEDLWQVELVSLLALLIFISGMVICLVPLIMAVEGWSPADAWGFVWYTMTTIGLGDKTMDLTHPYFAMSVLLLLLLLGTSAAQALMLIMQRASKLVEGFVAQGSDQDHSSGIVDRNVDPMFRDILERLTIGGLRFAKASGETQRLIQ